MHTLRINEMKHIGPHDLLLRFSNGYLAEVNLTRLLYGPIFIPLREPHYFSKVKLDTESGTLAWPNGADFAPESLYKMARALADLRSELLEGFEPEIQRGLFPEIEVKTKKTANHQAARFVTQLHRATNLHYDFRLELSGQLISWALDGLSLRAEEKQAAKRMDDHGMRALEPIGERLIAPGRVGAGPILRWDIGEYFVRGAVGRMSTMAALQAGLEKGSISLILIGKKLQGAFTLFREKHAMSDEWILVKQQDQFTMNEDITQQSRSVQSGMTTIK